MRVVATIKLNVPKKIYQRDPEQTQLGKKIVNHGIRLIDELGFEDFTFKKLAQRIGSTEASIYRYFENKHNLLVYLVSWYWSWLEYQVDYATNNIESPEKKLKIAIRIVANTPQREDSFSHISEAALRRIVVAESPKSYHTKGVDTENQDNFFSCYKSLCRKIADFLLEINPDFPYSRALTSTMLEAAHQQVFFSQHLPSLTELEVKNQEDYMQVVAFLEYMTLNLVRPKPESDQE